MAEIEIALPAIVTIANVSDRNIPFVPKGQNYTITIKAGDSFKFTVISIMFNISSRVYNIFTIIF